MSRQDDIAVSRLLGPLAEAIQHVLDENVGDKRGFCLIAFGRDENSTTSYVSNCDRTHVAGALRELLARWDGDEPLPPIHEVN